MTDRMKSHARVIIIGGGVTGCSILYHLAKMGWKDSILLERRELTSGSTWHAAGNLFTLTSPNSVSALQKYTFDLYPQLEAESGQSTGFHPTGGLSLARTPDQTMALKIARGRGRRIGIESEFISFEEAQEHAPLLNTGVLDAVLWEPMKGHVDPASATMAYAKAARNLGATVYRQTEVIEMKSKVNGGWQIITNNGPIDCEILVNAAGLWAREVAAMAGISLPLMPVEHHYLVTEPIPEIEAMTKEFPSVSDPESNLYSRQEGQGLLLGAYESHCHHWAEEGTPLNFDHELLADDLTRIEWNINRACEILPAIAKAGVKRVINGPMIFSPDLGPLLGPVEGMPDYFCACGVMTGFNQGGGVGRELAHWIIDGEPSIDIFCWDVTRFGDHVGPAYTKARTKFFYENRSARVYPDQQFEVGRPVRTFPIYEKQKQAGAVFGESFGWESPLWYAREGDDGRDIYSYRRGNWFDTVGKECRIVRDSSGLFDISTFAKYFITGLGAEGWLNTLLTNRIPTEVGRSCLSPMLSINGRVIGDFTVTKLSSNKFLLLGAGAMQRFHMRHFISHLPGDGTAKIENISSDWSGLMLAGPNSRSILAEIVEEDVGPDAFPFLSAQSLTMRGVPSAIAVRVSFTGEMGYEIYCPMEYQCAAFNKLIKAGSRYGLNLAGVRALMSLRLEKAFPSWGADLGPDYTPFECGMDRFVCLGKECDFIGRKASLEASKKLPIIQRVLLSIDADNSDSCGGEAVFSGDERIGYVSSGGYGHTLRRSLALAYLRSETFSDGAECHVEILGESRAAIMHKGALFDPSGYRMRG